jgi:phospholipid/cholesterol/gamma-HCH transport system permease protein
MNLFYHIGKYFMLLVKVFSRPEKFSIYRKQVVNEIMSLGLGSLGIVSIISVFMGAVLVIQTASNIDSAWLPEYTVGFTTRQGVILEFSPTIIALILAGKVGSNIASEVGMMRVTEQIDALEIMGINSAAYLILPKIIASVFINPFLVIISMFLALGGGWLVSFATGICSTHTYIYGIQYDFDSFSIHYSLFKTMFFAFAIASIPAYHGYYVKGGALEVGKASTRSVVYSSIVVLLLNYVLTQIMLM